MPRAAQTPLAVILAAYAEYFRKLSEAGPDALPDSVEAHVAARLEAAGYDRLVDLMRTYEHQGAQRLLAVIRGARSAWPEVHALQPHLDFERYLADRILSLGAEPEMLDLAQALYMADQEVL